MSKTCDNNFALIIYDNPCYFDKSYDNPLFVPNSEMHGTKEFCLENVYDKALDDGPIMLDYINCNTIENEIGGVLTSWNPYLLRMISHLVIKLLKVGLNLIPLFFSFIKIMCL